ncbi:MAG: glycosyltransferase family 2 protein [Bacteroidales bacterium]|nr:glycosyltransferase family 2 protein [Bacteroidales bacterium]MDD4602450.1 glycosyltransferase family 2 protein [Bacteroidales bacterium]
MLSISVVIIVRNEEKVILRCLNSVQPFADEIVVVDSCSNDHTATICRDFGCKVFQREFDGFGSQKQFAVNQATHDWVFSIDADEVVTDELQQEILTIKKDFKPTAEKTGNQDVGFRIPFSLCFMGHIMRYSGVGKEVHLRIFNRTHGRFTLVPVHEGIEVQGHVGLLKGKIIHYSYRNISHHLEKINGYTTQAAQGYFDQGKVYSKLWPALKFPASFLSFYVLKKGFMDGYPGFMWSFLAAVYATLKVAKTIELKTS